MRDTETPDSESTEADFQMRQAQVVAFRLYVTGNAPNSLLARENLTSFCSSYLAGRHQVEIIDLIQQPERALADHIAMTPTLIKLAPPPEERFVGSLSDAAPLLASLGLERA